MKTEHIYAAVSVADIEASIAWYGRLFGRNVDERPMREAAEWRLTDGGGVQLVLDQKRAGKSMVTVGVSDLDAVIKDCETAGVQAKRMNTGSGPFLLAQVSDPDGNVLTFAQRNPR
jgi:predicted enzyme related to lactoylglutathione lyase